MSAVRARFRIVFNVTRTVEVDEPEFRRWAQDRYGDGYDTELAMAAWIDAQDTEFVADVFPDFRISAPLPSDFDLQYYEVEDVERTQTGQERDT